MFRLLAPLLLATCTASPAKNGAAQPQSPAATPPATAPARGMGGDAERADGTSDAQACNTDADCGAGVCEGEGCGEMQGRCAPATGRICTRDLQTYCGCDGQTFQGSGSCPGKRFASRGSC